ncbi:hypothetical protein K1T71_009403 [Dendrolimus kikuchii]|uniref:Uncharacterized protein n=1 Tax=Dendrolimus kikuchii TaxID=765133 RepID=A0ACC1CUK8_9NEOP|nr:hypothetical protein K1T71_009403 [Dendrolimus kikuchii]
MVTFTDFSYIQPHIENIKNIINTVKTTCNSYKSSKIQTDCSNTLNPLETLLVNVENNFIAVSHLTNKNRIKRSSWFGFGGLILKQLFGSLDEDDAKTFSDAINAVQDDQRHLSSLMKDNIHVISSAIDTFNNTIRRLNDNEQILNQNMGKLDTILETVLQTTSKLETSSYLSLTFSAIESSLITLNFNLEDIIDAILFGKQNIIHPSILSPVQLYNELKNMHTLLDISSVSSFVNGSKLVFVIRIPLINLQEYNLYHIFALPTPHDINNPHSFAMINPTTRFLAITDDKLMYSTMDSTSECKSVTKEYYLCKLSDVHPTATNPICEVIILTKHINKLPKPCDYKVIISDIDVWQKLNNNKWLYVQSDLTKLSVKCNNTLSDYDIVGTGILKVPKGCKAFHNLLQFVASTEYESKLYLPSPNFNIIEDDCCSKKRINNTIPYLTPIKLSHIDLDSLHYVTHRLNQFSDEIEKIENQPYHIKYGNYFSGITTILSVCVLAYMSFTIYKKCCKKPRRDTTQNEPGCCIKIFNNCYAKPNTQTNLQIQNRAFEVSENSEESPSSLRRNLHIY